MILWIYRHNYVHYNLMLNFYKLDYMRYEYVRYEIKCDEKKIPETMNAVYVKSKFNATNSLSWNTALVTLNN